MSKQECQFLAIVCAIWQVNLEGGFESAIIGLCSTVFVCAAIFKSIYLD